MVEIKVDYSNSVVIVSNNNYPHSVQYNGKEKLPDIGTEYLYLQWSDVAWYESYWVDMNNHIQVFNDEQLNYIQEICSNWEQPLGQEGNPTLEQAQKEKQAKLTIKFNMDVDALTSSTAMSEMISWSKQESEARAWLYNASVNTPFIDILLTARNTGKTEPLETKQELVSKIITKADAYNNIYASMLGEYQNKVTLVYNATTIDEVNLI